MGKNRNGYFDGEMAGDRYGEGTTRGVGDKICMEIFVNGIVRKIIQREIRCLVGGGSTQTLFSDYRVSWGVGWRGPTGCRAAEKKKTKTLAAAVLPRDNLDYGLSLSYYFICMYLELSRIGKNFENSESKSTKIEPIGPQRGPNFGFKRCARMSLTFQ